MGKNPVQLAIELAEQVRELNKESKFTQEIISNVYKILSQSNERDSPIIKEALKHLSKIKG